MYDRLIQMLSPYIGQARLFKVLFNLSPMYRRSTGRIHSVTADLYKVTVRIPLSYKNRNYVGTIFGGSLFAATDPIYMIQLIQILGRDYVVWDKATTIKFKRPANDTAYAVFEFSENEIEEIKNRVASENEIDLLKVVLIAGENQKVFAEAEKTIYISNKAYYKEKQKKKSASAD